MSELHPIYDLAKNNPCDKALRFVELVDTGAEYKDIIVASDAFLEEMHERNVITEEQLHDLTIVEDWKSTIEAMANDLEGDDSDELDDIPPDDDNFDDVVEGEEQP